MVFKAGQELILQATFIITMIEPLIVSLLKQVQSDPVSYPVIGTLISPEMGTYMQRDESRDSIPIFSAKNEFG